MQNKDHYFLSERAANVGLKFIIAIDGTSASGKGSIAKVLAEKFHMKYFASSVFYRRLASIAHSKTFTQANLAEIISLSQNTDLLKNYSAEDLYSEHITDLCSQISVIPEVRANLKPLQRSLIDDNLRVILDGRDIGSVIAPDAHLKLFIDADLEERTRRRYKQLQDNNKSCMMHDIFQNLQARDERDKNRKIAPLKVAEDAYIIDNSGSMQETLDRIMVLLQL